MFPSKLQQLLCGFGQVSPLPHLKTGGHNGTDRGEFLLIGNKNATEAFSTGLACNQHAVNGSSYKL